MRQYRDGSIDVQAGGYLDPEGFTPVANPELERAAEIVGAGCVEAFNYSLYGFSKISGRSFSTDYIRLFDADPRTERRIGKLAGAVAGVAVVMLEAKTHAVQGFFEQVAVDIAEAISFRGLR